MMKDSKVIKITNYNELFDNSKEYFIENRKSEKTGIGRVAKSFTDFASKAKLNFSTTRNTILGRISQFSIFNIFLLFFSNKNKIHVFPYTVFPPIGLSKLNYIFFVHDLYQFNEHTILKEKLYNKIFTYFILNADTIVFNSITTKDNFFKVFQDNITEKKFYVIDSEVIPPIKKIGNVCIYVGSNKKNKNLDLLERIATEYVKSKNRKFIFVGISIDDFVNRNKHYIFMNGISDELLSFIYNNVDFLVSSSTEEGFCFPVKDAVHHGVNVLALRIPVFDELYKNNDLVTLFDNEQSMLEYISTV